MPNSHVNKILDTLKNKFGIFEKLDKSQSLYKIPSKDIYIYFRYSKLFDNKNYQSCFYGLRDTDLKLLSLHNSFICFVSDNDFAPILIPYKEFEYYFNLSSPSSDGQHKVLIFFKQNGKELYISNVGKFNVDSYSGLEQLNNIDSSDIVVPELNHSQIQSLIGAIGIKKGYDIWYPSSDKIKMDKNILIENKILGNLPNFSLDIDNIIQEIDVIWIDKNKPITLFEVEHSTPIYSALLRFNDVLLSFSNVNDFNIVANTERESKFTREINRPTFKQNDLIKKVTFLNYSNIYKWYFKLYEKEYK